MPFPAVTKKKIKFLGFVSISSLAVWISMQVKKTREILNGAFDPLILHVIEPRSVEDKGCPSMTMDAARWIKAPSTEEPFYVTKWKALKFAYARRLLSLAKADSRTIRWKATQQLAKVRDLDKWQYEQLAHSCNARTAVALARWDGADLRYQIQPFVSPNRTTTDSLVKIVRDFLVCLEQQSRHPCISYFLTNSFVDIHDMGKNEFETYGDHADQIAKCMKSSADMLPQCLESILHHSTIERHAKFIADNNGLYVLLELYSKYKHIYEVNVALCTVIANLSVFPDLAEEMHKTGWIGLLAKWARDKDIRLCVTASRALANLDPDDQMRAKYQRGIYSLHPTMRGNEQVKVDVVFIHGLLGGVFYTWRQRNREDGALGIFESITGEPEIWSLTKYYTSDEGMHDYLERFEDDGRMDWERLGRDFDLVSDDMPTGANVDADPAFSCTGYDKVRESGRKPDGRTQCWPRDWLTGDCQNLRVVGVNYDTSLSKWAGTCPEDSCKLTLEQRTDEMLAKLERAGIGRRPVVWVAHSMGGLIVKKLLVKANESEKEAYQNIFKNTKGVVFYSTPHKGSKIANLNQPASLVVLPSVEVQELREESPKLNELHTQFLDLIKNHPTKIISFIETKSTVVTALKFNFLMVETTSGNPGVGEVFEIPLDHLGICKPITRESFLYQKVLHLIRTVMREEDEQRCQDITGYPAEDCHTQLML